MQRLAMSMTKTKLYNTSVTFMSFDTVTLSKCEKNQ